MFKSTKSNGASLGWMYDPCIFSIHVPRLDAQDPLLCGVGILVVVVCATYSVHDQGNSRTGEEQKRYSYCRMFLEREAIGGCKLW